MMSIADDQHAIFEPREMRIKLQEMRRGRSFHDDQRMSVVDSIVRNCHDQAEIQGLSGEDRYTVMAWHLMHMAARLEKQVLEFAMLSPAPAIVLVRKEPHER
jgi:hypothetical protein